MRKFNSKAYQRLCERNAKNKIKELVNLYKKEKFEELILDPIIRYAGNNTYYTKPFEEQTGFKLPHETTTTQQMIQLSIDLHNYKKETQNGNNRKRNYDQI